MAGTFEDAQIFVNNELFQYISDSLEYDLGFGEKKVTTQVIGHGEVTNITTTDVSTQKSKVTFDMQTTSENQQKIITLNDNFDNNLVQLVARDSSTAQFQKMALINNPSFSAGPEGVVSLEFEGQKAVVTTGS